MKRREPDWRPKPAVLERVKTYFLGFHHNKREIYLRRSKIAARLKMSVRTLDRYIHYLSEIEWMATTGRTPRTAIRTVRGCASGGSVGGSRGGPLGESVGGSQKKEDQEGNPLRENLEGRPLKQHHQRDDVACGPEEHEILELAGVRKSTANLTALREIVAAGFTIEEIRGGVALGRIRHMINPAASAITSFRFFANPIAEARESYTPDHLKYTELRLKQELARRSTGAGQTGATIQ